MHLRDFFFSIYVIYSSFLRMTVIVRNFRTLFKLGVVPLKLQFNLFQVAITHAKCYILENQ